MVTILDRLLEILPMGQEGLNGFEWKQNRLGEPSFEQIMVCKVSVMLFRVV